MKFPDISEIRKKTQETPHVLAKWEASGLLKDVPDNQKEIIAWMLENQERSASQ